MINPGTLVGDRYTVVDLVGEGGLSFVYEVTDSRLPGRWALKQMKQLGEVEQFLSEAEILANLSHPNLPRVIDCFVEAGCPYLVMEFVEGDVLQAPAEADSVTEWAIIIAQTLEYLHSQGLIYRDLKPSNVMLRRDGQLFLVDFGIARFYKQGKDQDTLVMGTPGFAAPEQYGRAQSDARADVYGLGVLMHHLLTGHEPSQTPFRLPPVDCDARLARIISKATRLEPEERFASAAEMRLALEGAALIDREQFRYPVDPPVGHRPAAMVALAASALSWTMWSLAPAVPVLATCYLPFWLRLLYRDYRLTLEWRGSVVEVDDLGLTFNGRHCPWDEVTGVLFRQHPRLHCRVARIQSENGEFEIILEAPTDFYGLSEGQPIDSWSRLCDRIVQMSGLSRRRGEDDYLRERPSAGT